MSVLQFKEKIPVFEAGQWTDDNEGIMAISEWLTANEWPLLEDEEVNTGDVGVERKQGHAVLDTGELHIQYPQDFNLVQIGSWVVMSRRYHYLEFLSNEDFAYKYEQYGS